MLAGTVKELPDAEIEARGHLLALAENIIVLIWSLAEASWKTLEAVNAAHCEGLLLKALQGREALSPGVALAAAQALYSLTQDNAPFASALLAQPNALPVLVGIVRADHSAAEADAKGKGRARKAMDEEDDEMADGRALLTRVLVAGALRNLVEPGSAADSSVSIVPLTNEVILPLINGLLEVNLAQAAQRVSELVAEIVSSQNGAEADGSQRPRRSSARTSRSTTSRRPRSSSSAWSACSARSAWASRS